MKISYQESLSEYGSGWEWDTTYAHVFDYTKTDIDIPEKYTNSIGTTIPTVNGTWMDYGNMTSTANPELCEYESTDGQMLVSGSQKLNNISCYPHSYNAGNYYNFPAASASTPEPATSSICPRGWMLPQNNRSTSYANFLRAYDVDYSAPSRTNQDSALLNLPLSFLHLGYYNGDGSLYYQGSGGYYRMSSLSLGFGSGHLRPTDGTGANNGFSVRCVAR